MNREERELARLKRVRVGGSSARSYWIAGLVGSLILIMLIAGPIVGWGWALAGAGALFAVPLIAFAAREAAAGHLVTMLTQEPGTGRSSVRANKQAAREAARLAAMSPESETHAEGPGLDAGEGPGSGTTAGAEVGPVEQVGQVGPVEQGETVEQPDAIGEAAGAAGTHPDGRPPAYGNGMSPYRCTTGQVSVRVIPSIS